MNSFRLNEQITFLRKGKGITQEELAQALGVTNQAVSKWESGQCCPDIQLLPDIAGYFGVSIDELMGYKAADSFENVYLKIKQLFADSPAETAFRSAFRLSVLLHEAACSRGYKSYIPWDTDKNFGLKEDGYKWGFSACSETEGNTVHAGNAVFIADGASYRSPTPSQLQDIYLSIERLCDKNVLKVLYALCELTVADFDIYASIAEIAAKSKLTDDETEKALLRIPITVKEDEDGETLCRLEGSYMHMPALLLMLREK